MWNALSSNVSWSTYIGHDPDPSPELPSSWVIEWARYNVQHAVKDTIIIYRWFPYVIVHHPFRLDFRRKMGKLKHGELDAIMPVQCQQWFLKDLLYDNTGLLILDTRNREKRMETLMQMNMVNANHVQRNLWLRAELPIYIRDEVQQIQHQELRKKLSVQVSELPTRNHVNGLWGYKLKWTYMRSERRDGWKTDKGGRNSYK